MAITTQQKKFNNSIILIIRGRVSAEDTLTISKKIISLSLKNIRAVVVDLSCLEYLSSHWIGAFVHTWKELNDRGKQLLFYIPKGFIQNQFTAAHLGRVFTIIESMEEIP